jgi:hypothetical protein
MNFYSSELIETCDALINEVSSQEVTKITPLTTNIQAILIYDQKLNFFPRNLEKFFKTLTILELSGCELSQLTANDLKPFNQLIEFAFTGNKIKELHHNLFVHNRKLIRIDLHDNWLISFGHEVFTTLPHIQLIDLSSNECIDDKIETHSQLMELNYVISINCPPTKSMLIDELIDDEVFLRKSKEIVEAKVRDMKMHIGGVIKQLQVKIKELEHKIPKL